MNDRALRKVTIAQTLKKEQTRNDNFIITVATEMMAILCIAKDMEDLRKRVDNIIISKNTNGGYVYVKDLNITGSIMALLKEAIKPNLVQTLENTPAFVHGGPFANIAHGCSSIIGTDLALKLSDYVITEAGFGADLGAEKFLDIKVRELGKEPDLIVLVVSLRAVKEKSFEKGIPNILKHYNNLTEFNKKVIICINRFETDDENEIESLKNNLKKENNNIIIEECTSWKDGGKGAKYEDLQAFDNLPYPNKVVFTHKPYPELKSAFYIKGFENEGEVGDLFTFSGWNGEKYYDQFDYVSWFNQK